MVGESAKLTVRKSVIFSHSMIVKLLVKRALLTSRGTIFYNNLLTNVAFLKAYYFNASHLYTFTFSMFKERKK